MIILVWKIQLKQFFDVIDQKLIPSKNGLIMLYAEDERDVIFETACLFLLLMHMEQYQQLRDSSF